MSTATTTTPMADFDTATPDASLGRILHTDNDRPPAGTFAFGPAYDGTCFIVKDNLLYYCKPKQPEHWPALYYVEVSPPSDPLVTGVFHNGQVYVFTAHEMYYIQGTGNNLFLPLRMNARSGAQGIFGACSVAGKGVFHVGHDGIYLFNNGADMKISEDVLEPIFRGETTNGIPGLSGDKSDSVLFAKNNNLYFTYKGSGDSQPSNVLVMNLDSGRVSYYAYNDGSAVEIHCMTFDRTNDRILIGDNTGYVRVIESTDYTDDSGAAISWEVQSKEFTLQTRAHFPRFVKYDVDASGADSVTGSLLLDGTVHQTHTITGSRNTVRRLVGTGNGNKASVRVSGTGPATVYAVEFE